MRWQRCKGTLHRRHRFQKVVRSENAVRLAKALSRQGLPPHSTTLSRVRNFCACSNIPMQRSLTSLILVALLCGFLWRAELELRWGWAGLAWAWKLYAAFPLNMASFAAWVVLITRVRERAKFAAAQMTFFMLALVFFWCYLRHVVPALMGPFPAFNFLVVWMLPVFWVFLPLSFGWLCRLFGVRVHFGLHLVSSVLFTASWPLAIWLLEVVDHRGGADLIHALKSGFVIPLLVLSLGFPLLFAKRADESAARTA